MAKAIKTKTAQPRVATKSAKKTVVTHPVTGTEMKFDKTIYEPVKSCHPSKPERKQG